MIRFSSSEYHCPLISVIVQPPASIVILFTYSLIRLSAISTPLLSSLGTIISTLFCNLNIFIISFSFNLLSSLYHVAKLLSTLF
uniref:Uncharacterized protein n=1 Tax=Staphylococcus phage 184DA TaxID=3110532 RepID=A0AAU6MXS3_9CAUD